MQSSFAFGRRILGAAAFRRCKSYLAPSRLLDRHAHRCIHRMLFTRASVRRRVHVHEPLRLSHRAIVVAWSPCRLVSSQPPGVGAGLMLPSMAGWMRVVSGAQTTTTVSGGPRMAERMGRYRGRPLGRRQAMPNRSPGVASDLEPHETAYCMACRGICIKTHRAWRGWRSGARRIGMAMGRRQNVSLYSIYIPTARLRVCRVYNRESGLGPVGGTILYDLRCEETNVRTAQRSCVTLTDHMFAY
jgi:hypothetical protein